MTCVAVGMRRGQGVQIHGRCQQLQGACHHLLQRMSADLAFRN